MALTRLALGRLVEPSASMVVNAVTPASSLRFWSNRRSSAAKAELPSDMTPLCDVKLPLASVVHCRYWSAPCSKPPRSRSRSAPRRSVSTHRTGPPSPPRQELVTARRLPGSANSLSSRRTGPASRPSRPISASRTQGPQVRSWVTPLVTQDLRAMCADNRAPVVRPRPPLSAPSSRPAGRHWPRQSSCPPRLQLRRRRRDPGQCPARTRSTPHCFRTSRRFVTPSCHCCRSARR